MPFHRRHVISLLSALICLPKPMAAQAGKTLRFGLTPVFLDNEWHVLELLREHILLQTGAQVEFVQRRTYKEVVALLLPGEIDGAWLCGYPLMQNKDRLGAIAVPVWQGSPIYQAYVITTSEPRSLFGMWSMYTGLPCRSCHFQGPSFRGSLRMRARA